MAGTLVVCTDVGRSRSHNEDNFLIFDVRQHTKLEAGKELRYSFASPGLLVGVADGMGGHSSGQVAAQLCVETLPAEFLKRLPENPSGDTDWDALLAQAVHATNEALLTTAKGNREYEGMGTTLTTALFLGRQARIAQVGDSRCYLFRGGNLTQLTQDQTVFNTLGEEERAALRDTPFENMLLQAVGAMAKLEVITTDIQLRPADLLLFCSDGLYKVVTNEEMAEVLKGEGGLKKKADVLIERANNAGGPDNITVILCQVGD
ncbi:MAG TPA: protein phosphatase 2C domain-containing protein [Candidatus Acidoferrales bacterium]